MKGARFMTARCAAGCGPGVDNEKLRSRGAHCCALVAPCLLEGPSGTERATLAPGSVPRLSRGGGPMTRERILVVDPDDAELEAMKRGLSAAEFDVLTARSADEAMTLAETQSFDAALVEL